MFGRKQHLQERAEDLIIDCRYLANRCNEEDNFNSFMEYLMELLDKARELCGISKKIKLKGVTGDPCSDYAGIKDNLQCSIQSALKRHYNKASEEIRHTRSQRSALHEVSTFQYAIEQHREQFEPSTSSVAEMLLNTLESSARSLPEDLPISKDVELLVSAAKAVAGEDSITATAIQRQLGRQHHLSYTQACEVEEQLLRCGIVAQNTSTGRNYLAIADTDLIRMKLNSAISPEALFPQSPMLEVDSMDGIDFEHWCARLLEANGFVDVRVTRGSGDQGVDILATKEEILYAIQCKCYSSDLGNTPIQEVCAGRTFYQCQVGAVMTNRYFTAGARKLAKANGVLLWDRDRLTEWIEKATSEQTEPGS